MCITIPHHDHASDVSVLLLYLCTYFIAIQPEDEGSSAKDNDNKCKVNFIGCIL